MTRDELNSALEQHALWLRDCKGGKRANLRYADLRGANLRKADLRDADMRDANLLGAELHGAYLWGASLRGSDLRGASLRGADLRDADMRDADLREADMRDADLREADLRGANLRGADLSNINLNGTIGNMLQIKSAQFDTWPITWTRDQSGVTTLQIGCQKHDAEEWRSATPDWIDEMDEDATDWWNRYRDIVLALVDASPAAKHAG